MTAKAYHFMFNTPSFGAMYLLKNKRFDFIFRYSIKTTVSLSLWWYFSYFSRRDETTKRLIYKKTIVHYEYVTKDISANHWIWPKYITWKLRAYKDSKLDNWLIWFIISIEMKQIWKQELAGTASWKICIPLSLMSTLQYQTLIWWVFTNSKH